MMKRIFTGMLLSVTLISASFSFAKEPTNLAIVKKQLIQYHDSGEYAKDTDRVMTQAMAYLKKRVAMNKTQHKKLALVLDIDETSLSNYQDMVRLDFGGTIEEIRQDEDKAEDPAIAPTLALYNYAKANGVAVFFLTGRHEDERDATEKNLAKAGYQNWDKLILRSAEQKNMPAAQYKSAERQKIEADGYDIVLNIGDQQSDLRGGYADKTFKLPNPYYFIP